MVLLLAASRGFRVDAASSSTTLYVHCGGLEGLDTSLRRYAREGLLHPGEDAAMALATARAHIATLLLVRNLMIARCESVMVVRALLPMAG